MQRGGPNILPQILYAAWAVAFVLVFTGLNLRGVQTSSRMNALLALGMSIVVVVFIADAIRYIALVARPVGGQWLLPFYDPTTFAPGRLFHGASIAVLTYIGFYGISTMSEEVENPRRNILLTTVITWFAIGILSAIEMYLAQLAWPARIPFPASMVDTAYVQVALSRWRQVSFSITECDALDRQYGFRYRGAIRRRASSLWNGTHRCAAKAILRRGECEDENPAQQRATAGRYHAGRYVSVDI